MDNGLRRLQKKIEGDGPAERQILLMKLVHEFDNASDFGTKYVADAASLQQQWIARVGALMKRVSISHDVAFSASRSTAVQYWTLARESMRRCMSAAIEEIKLELELDGHDDIGQVYEAGQQHSFLLNLKKIILGAESEVFVVDPYFDGKAFETFLSPLGNTCGMRILCSRYSSDVAGHITAFRSQYNSVPKLRKNKKGIHDRLVIIDRVDCWIIGGSIKDGGKKPTYIVPLQPAISPSKIAIYEDLWGKSTEVEV